MQRIFLTTLSEMTLLGVVSLLGVLINGVGDYVLMFGKLGLPAMGAAGCAVSTSLTSVFMVLSIHWFLKRRGTVYSQASPAPSRELYRSIFQIGLPIGFVLLSEYLVLAGAGVLMGRHGVKTLAAFSVCLQWLAVFYMIPVGFSQAATTRIALAIGQRNLIKLKQAAGAAVGAAAAYGIGALVVMILERGWLAQAFLSQSAAAGIASQAAGYMTWNAGLLLLSSLVVACAGVLRGFRETKTPMLIVFLFYWVGSLGSAAALGTFFGDTGVWVGMVAGFTLTLLGLGSALIQKMKVLPAILERIAKEDSANLGHGEQIERWAASQRVVTD
jgi:MATE family multidrug resistance protein